MDAHARPESGQALAGRVPVTIEPAVQRFAFAPKLMRYSQAAIGPIVTAGAQFALSLALLRQLPPAAFGSFAFLLVASQLSWGFWTALFSAPLPLLITSGDKQTRDTMEQCLFATNLIAALLATLVFGGLALALALPPSAALLYAIYGSVALLRWFARTYGYVTGTPLRTMLSDLIYSAVLIAGGGIMAATGSASLSLVYSTLLISAAAGLLPFGIRYLVAQFVKVKPRLIGGYLAVWKQHSGWSLLGVLTTEATVNAHVYIVTALLGPTAFAPLAASALMIRPIGVAMNALSEFERAQMARQISARRIAEAIGSVRLFRWVLVAVWIGTGAVIAAMIRWSPHLLFPSKYDLRYETIGAVLWMIVAGMRLVRAPESALLQAAGQFRPLAISSLVSCGFSIAGVFVMLLMFGPLWSIMGIFIGEVVFAGWTWLQSHRWRQRAEQDARAAARHAWDRPLVSPLAEEGLGLP
jgi:O-antigen/teichoic acid export membrane protein